MSPTHSHSPEELADRGANRVRLDLQQTLQNCIVIDLETTGLRPQEERIIEIAALHIRNGELQDKYTTLLNPNLSVPQEITDLTGISDGLLADKPTFSEVMPELLNFLRDATLTEPSTSLGFESTPRLVGHNVSFDFSFLQHEILRTQLKNSADANRPYTPRLVCTAEASRTLIPRESVGRYRLGNVASYLKIPHRPLHRAMSDALATYDVLRALSTL
ncbi:3'-5' exonuclease [Corynebacterium jeikeium]|uniref:3'-5' exonuclease n=1 Tax=Corynebacterium jeikeium TaxID=38289 RepID=UPI00200B1F0B|nr:3'-5' exonuclease [Corynebacterium jeikeium]